MHIAYTKQSFFPLGIKFIKGFQLVNKNTLILALKYNARLATVHVYHSRMKTIHSYMYLQRKSRAIGNVNYKALTNI